MPIVALAGVGALVDALAALLILLALALMIWLVEKFGSYIPFVGAWLASNAAAFLSWSVQQLNNAYQGMIWALFDVVTAIQIVVIYPLNKVLDFTNATTGAVYWLRNVALPRILTAAYNYTLSEAQAILAWTMSLYNQAIDFSNRVLGAAYTYAQGLFYQLYGQLVAGLSQAYNYALTLYYQGIAYEQAIAQQLQSLIYQEITQFGLGLAALQQWTLGLLSTAVTSIEADLATLEQRLTAFLQAYVTAAEKDIITIVDGAAVVNAIPDALIDIRDEIASIPRAIPSDLIGALAALGALAVPLLRYLKECGVPMCRDLHGLLDLLGGLQDAAMDAALLAMVAEAIHDPHAAAREFNDIVGPIVRDAESLIKSLIGV
jgi:hypothetical protein